MGERTKFSELKRVIARLHGPGGCPWDRQQTYKSLIPTLRGEVREFAAAVANGDRENMQEEIGDILLHVMFFAQIASRKDGFTIEDVIAGLTAKLKRRHPHVFGKVKVSSPRAALATWRAMKKREKGKGVRLSTVQGRFVETR